MWITCQTVRQRSSLTSHNLFVHENLWTWENVRVSFYNNDGGSRVLRSTWWMGPSPYLYELPFRCWSFSLLLGNESIDDRCRLLRQKGAGRSEKEWLGNILELREKQAQVVRADSHLHSMVLPCWSFSPLTDDTEIQPSFRTRFGRLATCHFLTSALFSFLTLPT